MRYKVYNTIKHSTLPTMIEDHKNDLETRLVDKTPSDGLCGKTDEDNLGMTYRQLDDFLEKGTSGDEALDACIHRMHLANVHKLLPMPQYYLKR